MWQDTARNHNTHNGGDAVVSVDYEEGINASIGEGIGISGIRYVFDRKSHSMRRYFGALVVTMLHIY